MHKHAAQSGGGRSKLLDVGLAVEKAISSGRVFVASTGYSATGEAFSSMYVFDHSPGCFPHHTIWCSTTDFCEGDAFKEDVSAGD